jgi:hypothetical protein
MIGTLIRMYSGRKAGYIAGVLTGLTIQTGYTTLYSNYGGKSILEIQKSRYDKDNNGEVSPGEILDGVIEDIDKVKKL